MDSTKVTILDAHETCQIANDAKIVAFRWDILPWCLILDCDASADETANAMVQRAWVVFTGLSELTLIIARARLINGIFSLRPLEVSESSEGFYNYILSILTPIFDDAEKLANNPHNTMIIRAKGLMGAVSKAREYFGEYGPNRMQRNSLANDDELLEAITTALEVSKQVKNGRT